jgi:hypothetical protein
VDLLADDRKLLGIGAEVLANEHTKLRLGIRLRLDRRLQKACEEAPEIAQLLVQLNPRC